MPSDPSDIAHGTTFDVAVVGSGYAAFATALRLSEAGKRALLIGAGGDLVWESGRGFHPETGDLDEDTWRDFVREVSRRGGYGNGVLDGAIAEVVATDLLMRSRTEVLYYARPVGVEWAGSAVGAVILATKSGPIRVAARQWIDATDEAMLVRLAQPALGRPRATTSCVQLVLQHPDWSSLPSENLRPTAWPTERILTVTVDESDPLWRRRILDALTELQGRAGDEVKSMSMSHMSIRPVPIYEAGETPPAAAPNVATAVPGFARHNVRTLAQRFVLGLDAAADLSDAAEAELPEGWSDRPLPDLTPSRTLDTDVCVAGLGTGGAIAALAASMAGARVLGIEPMTFVGGVGTGGGIHSYWLGMAGGLQQTVDQRTRSLMSKFQKGPLGDGPFNPWAKMLALELMLDEHGIEWLTDSLVFAAETVDGHVSSVLAATADGIVRVRARSYVDGTGDGDLCVLAGASFRLGRPHDGKSNTYTQIAGRLKLLRDRPRMAVTYFDAGFCDPTNIWDHTRARLTGIRQQLLDRYDNLTRPTYVAPVLGLRQSRQIDTDYTLTLHDQVSRSRFADSIGFMAATFGNHATDYEFESDEAVFWVWANRQYTAMLAAEMNYRMLVPRGLANVWIASRCAGLSQDAHYAARMQRDIQRIGEAAGFAAGLAAVRGEDARDLPYRELEKLLRPTGILDRRPDSLVDTFGASPDVEPVGAGSLAASGVQSSARSALEALDRGELGEPCWWLYQHRDLVAADVLERLDPARGYSATTRWAAASIAAMWGESAAEPRLLEALAEREYGFDGSYEWRPVGHHLTKAPPDPIEGGWVSGQVVPNWHCAIVLLRRCGGEATLAALETLLIEPVLSFNTLTAVALTLEGLVERGVTDSPSSAERVKALVDRLLSMPTIGADDYAGRRVGLYSEFAIRGELDSLAKARVDFVLSRDSRVSAAFEDGTWQLQLVCSRVLRRLGLAIPDSALQYRADARAYVRRAFNELETLAPQHARTTAQP